MNQMNGILTLVFSIFLSGLFTVAAFAQSPSTPQYIYVSNQGSASISVIDAQSHEITDTIELQELGFSENAKPHHTVAEPDGSFWYVTLIGENTVLKFNRENELVGQVTTEVPGLLSLDLVDDHLYVGRSMSAVNPPQSFAVVERSTMTLLDEQDLFFTRPHALATSHDGEWSYVGSLSVNQILAVNIGDDESSLTTVDGETHTFINFAIHPDGNTMVATGQVSGKLLVFDISDPANPTMTLTIETKAMPWHPVFSPDGRYVYFGNKQAHTVSVVDMESLSVDTVIEGNGLAQPHGAALSLDGQYLFVSNNNLDGTYQPAGATTDNPVGTVTVINTETRTIEKVIEVGRYPSGIGTNAM